MVQLAYDLACDRVHFFDRLDLVSEKLDSDRIVLTCRIDVNRVAPHSEGAPGEVHVVTRVLYVHELAEDLFPRLHHARPQREHLVLIVERVSYAVYA